MYNRRGQHGRITEIGRGLVCCALLSLVWYQVAPPRAEASAAVAAKGLGRSEARRLIAAMLPGVELKTGAVRITEISSSDTTAEASADVRTAFRLRKGEGGRWVVTEVRTGDRQWEDVELLLRALGAAERHPLLDDLETLAAEVESRQREKEKSKERQGQDERADVRQSDVNTIPQGGTEAVDSQRVGEVALKSGTVIVAKDFSALLSSSTIEATLAMAFRFERDARNRWRVAEVGLGGTGGAAARAWRGADELSTAVNEEKRRRALAEMETTGAALEAFRRERGFYVVSDDHVALIDHLNPRYLTRVLRLDPWHRPYRYAGTRERYVLRSDGADGKEGTADDVTRASGQ